MKYESTKKAILEILQRDGYEVCEDLVARLDFFLSCIEKKPQLGRIESLLKWLGEQRNQCQMHVDIVPISGIEKWRVDPATGFISHETSEFFEVVGIQIRNGEQREYSAWCQPIIYQKEMGILGILCRRVNGERQYLLQAKTEPGNNCKVQISPTLQATISNLKRAHGGAKPLFAKYFEDPLPGSVLYATYQGEDGGRLYLKSNLNMLVEVDENEVREIPSNFRWFTMYEIKQLLKYENVINLKHGTKAN